MEPVVKYNMDSGGAAGTFTCDGGLLTFRASVEGRHGE